MKLVNIKRLLKILTNFYFVSTAVFFLLIFFIDKDSLLVQNTNNKKIKELKRQKEFYINQTKNNKEQINQLKTSDKNLEKFAREQYRMKKPNEDIFIYKSDKEEKTETN